MELSKYPPLPAQHPLVVDGDLCQACTKPFAVGDVVTLVILGPGDDPEQQIRARAGRPYSGVSLPIHWACATGEVE